MTDSHCHLASHRFSTDEIPAVIAKAKEAGVKRMITLATSEEDLTRHLSLAETFSEVHACIGIHPCDVHSSRDDFEAVLRPFLTHPKVAGIGETGLDYFHPAPEGWTEADYQARQRDFLRRHFELAREAGLNVVIHTRDRKGTASFDDALAIYADFSDEVQAVFHCFPGPWELAERVLAAGALISFTGIATFKNAKDCLEAARRTPLDRMMVETDSPYLAPEPHRGQRCEPAFVARTAQRIAEAKALPLEDFVKGTEAVCERFFRL
ncbi:TatD family hydrolase [Roseibacillus ishigakijimensis]|uniref:TatD family hydrolase n=1 Tax=Roseibacillus ishigakijimensis TaxID=454146 RepID=A0A934RUE4_9BACT|nr:TatD family hydrolase [Roseibacillus ishigakijimensis]MBK1835603.1 TatD family hydrolase [Roseibacillus ishigakijimensis]